MAKGSAFPVQSWHRCRRYWKKGLECAFHGKEEKDEDTEGDEAPRESGKAPRKRTGPRPVASTVEEVAPFATAGAEEMRIPVVAGVKADQRQRPLWQEEAFPDVGPLEVPLVPDRLPAPLYIPDEDIPWWTPPGQALRMANVGPASEEAFVQMISQETSTATRETNAGEEGERGFGALALAFSALFAANAVSHLWQTYNARVSSPEPVSRSLDTKTFSPPGRRSRKSIRKRAKAKPPKSTRPLPKPVKSTVGAGAGRGIHFKAQTFTRSPGLPLSQGAFRRVFVRTLNKPVVLGGGLDED